MKYATDILEQMKEALEGVADGPWFALRNRGARTLKGNYPQWDGWWDVVNEHGSEVCNSSGDGGMEEPQARFIAAARTLLPEAIKEIEELRASIKGKTFTVLSDDGEAWKARAEAAEAKLAKAVKTLNYIEEVATKEWEQDHKRIATYARDTPQR